MFPDADIEHSIDVDLSDDFGHIIGVDKSSLQAYCLRIDSALPCIAGQGLGSSPENFMAQGVLHMIQ